jgi:hypothetical protein
MPVLDLYRVLRCHESHFGQRQPFLTPVPGRGGGIRTPTSGFGDRQSTVELTPLFKTSRKSRVEELKASFRSLTFDFQLFDFFVGRVVTAFLAKLLELQTVLMLLLVPGCRIIAILTITALQGNDFAHRWFPQ